MAAKKKAKKADKKAKKSPLKKNKKTLSVGKKKKVKSLVKSAHQKKKTAGSKSTAKKQKTRLAKIKKSASSKSARQSSKTAQSPKKTGSKTLKAKVSVNKSVKKNLSKKNNKKKNKPLKKTTKKAISKAAKNFTKPQKSQVRKTSKITKADAARSAASKAAHNTISEKSHTKQKQYPKENIKKTEEKEISIEKVMEETKEADFLPKSAKSSENTGFSDTLSDDLSSVFSKTSEEIPEPPGKFTMEFACKTSPELLYKFLTDPVELTEWFCDDVNIRNGIYTFVWNGLPHQARLVKQERNISVRFQWLDKNDGSYFEFNIHKNPLTGDVILYVTDFSEPEEMESNKLWWTSQINKLKTILGLQY